MTLPAAGSPISMGQVNTELGLSGAVSLNDTGVRSLFGVSSGAISLSNGYGKTFANGVYRPTTYTPIQGNGTLTNPGNMYDGSLSTYGSCYVPDTYQMAGSVVGLNLSGFPEGGSITSIVIKYMLYSEEGVGYSPNIALSASDGSNTINGSTSFSFPISHGAIGVPQTATFNIDDWTTGYLDPDGINGAAASSATFMTGSLSISVYVSCGPMDQSYGSSFPAEDGTYYIYDIYVS